MCLQGCLQKRLAFESVHWVKRKGKFILSEEKKKSIIPLPLDIGPPGSQALGLIRGLSKQRLHPNSQAFELGLNYTTGIPGSPDCREQTWDFWASIITWTNSYKKKSLLLYIYICIYICIYPIVSVSLENSDTTMMWRLSE